VTDEDAVKGFEVKSYEELRKIGVESGDQFLLFHVDFHQILHHCYFREFVDVDRIARANRSTGEPKRLLDGFIAFFDGLACLCLARQTFQAKYRTIGEQVIETMIELAHHSRWNIENKLFLMQAELHYLNGEYEKAEASYEASIASARCHRFLNEEAYAYELYGVYLLENRMVDKGHEKLDIAIEKYAKWGALKKVEHVKKFKEVMNPKFLSKNGIIE
jgi:tetratricopeptide (TPR) repeat protein